MRSLLVVTCCALSYLPSGLDSMTVSPIVYLTTVTPRPLAYRSPPPPPPPSVRGASYGYGHRSLPPPSARRVRDGQGYVPYESAGTYEYMTNPGGSGGGGSGGKYRVPKTERLPPGDADVEYVSGPNVRDSDNRESTQENEETIKKKKKKKSRKTKGAPTAKRSRDYEYGESENEQRAEPEPESSRNVRKGIQRGKGERDDEPMGKGRKKNGAVVGTKNREEIIDKELDATGKHKIHKKNEFSKQQQFFDEQHIDGGKKKPAATRSGNAGRKKGHKKGAEDSSKKRRRRAKKGKKDQEKHGYGKQRSHYGYGQILAIR